MKVIVAHNRYRSSQPSGENLIVESEIELLRGAGHEVVPLIEDSDELAGSVTASVNAVMGPVRSPRGVRRLKELLQDEQPDVLHLHNVYPLISPWSVRTAKAAGVPVVQTVHNYRHTCVAGMHLRNGATCEDCVGRRIPFPAVQHRCYRSSRPQSTAMAVGQMVHRSTWRQVDQFLVSSPHMQTRLAATGVPLARIAWRPTYAEDVGAVPQPSEGPVLFVGRLEQAKGITLLLDAWTSKVAELWGQLVVAGDGPLRGLVIERSANDATVLWAGSLPPSRVLEHMRRSRLVVLPSLWLEGFPRVAAEAMSVGRPMMFWEGAGVSRVTQFGTGWSLPDAASAWSEKFLSVSGPELQESAKASRQFYEEHCSPAVALRQLERVYSSVSREPRA